VKSIETGRIVSYSWSGPAGTNSVKNWVITPATEASAGTYSITVTDGNGCSAATSHDVIVANPQIDFSQVVTDQEAPFIVQLNPGTFQDYSWSNGSTESSIIVNEFGTYTVTVSDYDCYDTESITFNEYQDISLAQGWGMFSTYINQTNNIANVMSAITNSIFLVKNNSGQVYWPAMTINNINNMVIGQGYQVKMSQSALLTIVGTSVLPQNTPVQLNAGINTIGMLRHTPVSAADLFAPVVQDLVYVKLNNGMVYLPQYQVNQVVTMYPDDAFKVMMLHSGVITYPANNDNLPDKGAYELRETAYYAAVTNSGNNMTLVLPQAVVQGLLKDGDEVAVYTANNLLVGSAVYTGETLAMPVWGQDETQQQKSGLSASESFILEVYNHQNGLTTRFENVEYESGDGSYHDNSVAVVKTLNLNLNLKLSLYPNPATDYVDVNFSLPEATSARIELYNALGQLVLGKSIDNQEGEQHHSITVSHLPAGTYTLKLITKSEIKEASLIVH